MPELPTGTVTFLFTRAHLDPATCHAADTMGRTWTLEQAIATAIQQPTVHE